MIEIKVNSSYSNEIEYILKVLFKDFLGIPFVLLNKSTFCKDSFVINVGGEDKLSFPNVLLNSEVSIFDIDKNSLVENSWDYNVSLKDDKQIEDTVPVIFGRRDFDTKIRNCPIDIFSTAFYFLSGLDEYNCKGDLDRHERFDYKNSTLFRLGVHERPLINEYLEILYDELQKVIPNVKRKKWKYSVKLSHDVDHPLSFNYGYKVVFKDFLKDLIIRKSPSLFFKRLRYYFHSNRLKFDPNNNFKFIMDVSDELGIISHFNFIPIDGQGGINGAYEIDSPFFHRLLKEIDKRGHKVGFHPSYGTYKDYADFQSEIEKLRFTAEKAGVKQKIEGGRHHYLRFKIPDTWVFWDKVGLVFDSSIGFNLIHGFRSGVCYPYQVFDLKSRKELELIEYPLIFMDVNYSFNRSLNQYLAAKLLSSRVKHFDGVFTLLYHNNYIISKQEKVSYRNLLETVL